ncbi:MAG: translation initiation factor 2 [Firmicutes bacterium]|nr:translation initiation factor 2 [Bacillota bacterium]
MKGNKTDELELLPCCRSAEDVYPGEILLRHRVAALEEKIEQMKASRRVLLRLLERADQERRIETGNLRMENQRLRRQNKLLAHSLWDKNREIVLLKGRGEG